MPPKSVNATEETQELITADVIPSEIADRVIVTGKIKVMSAGDYEIYSQANNRGKFGREKGVKTKLSPEELRVLINAGWTAEDVKDKHGINDAELEQVVFKLSKLERLEKPIVFGKKVLGA